MRPQSYIGITGFMSREEVDGVLSVLPDDTDRLVMIGVLASGKTLRGEPNKWPRRYPKVDEVWSIFPRNRNTLNLIHFNTKEPALLLEDMLYTHRLAGPHCHGFQLNLAWPDRDVLASYRRQADFKRKTIVLQCGGGALEQIDWKAEKLVERVREYDGVVDYMLIDPSGGAGKDFDAAFASSCFASLSMEGPASIGMGIAGGLHGGNIIRKLSGLLLDHDFSIDAEGKLRTQSDDLDVKAAMMYLKTGDALYNLYKSK